MAGSGARLKVSLLVWLRCRMFLQHRAPGGDQQLLPACCSCRQALQRCPEANGPACLPDVLFAHCHVFVCCLPLLRLCVGTVAEHMGTKTAVQIRSHAQKFFSKLTKGTAAESEWHMLAGLVSHGQQLLDQVVHDMQPASKAGLQQWVTEWFGSVCSQTCVRKQSTARAASKVGHLHVRGRILLCQNCTPMRALPAAAQQLQAAVLAVVTLRWVRLCVQVNASRYPHLAPSASPSPPSPSRLCQVCRQLAACQARRPPARLPETARAAGATLHGGCSSLLG